MSNHKDSVQVVFVRTSGILPAITRYLTKSDFNHVYLDIPVWGRRMVLEAASDGRVRVLPKFYKKFSLRESYSCNFDTRFGLRVIAALLGRKYDFLGVLLIGLSLIANRWFGFDVSNWRWKTSNLKCSELLILFLSACSVFDELMDIEKASPEDVRVWIIDHPELFEKIE